MSFWFGGELSLWIHRDVSVKVSLPVRCVCVALDAVCLWCRPGASSEVRLLDCGTKVSVSVLSCMILLSVSQFNREAFGEWQWGCRGGGGDALTHTHVHTHTHTSALIHTDLCGLSTMPVFVFDRKIDSLAGRDQPPWRIKTRKVLVAVNHFSVH